jgi:extracellular elastinolytic metalloproteinase
MRPPAGLAQTVLAVALLALSASAWAQSSFSDPKPQELRAPPGQVLGAVGGGTRAGAVGASLRTRGASDATAHSLVESGHAASKLGHTHVRLTQQVGGLTVYGSDLKATFNAGGDLLHVTGKIAAVPAGAPRPASIAERGALDAVIGRLYPDTKLDITAMGAAGSTSRFKAGDGFFHEDPQVTRVLVPQTDGTLAQGFLVETWTRADNRLQHALVGGDGAILKIMRRTASDQYKVFTVDPGKTPQAIVSGPGGGNTESPAGWLFAGAQNTVNISGNNVNAYLDVKPDDKADKGGTAVTNQAFLTDADLSVSPGTTTNRAVAVQNLFYLTNQIHDILYKHGFVEGAGNFQVSNFNKGGLGGDPVSAEAQDGGGTDNADFATPPEGRRPRMQMYLWTGVGFTHEIVLTAPSALTIQAMGAEFGKALNTKGVAAEIAVGNDGFAAPGGGTPTDGCEALPSTLKNKIVLLDRGYCSFAQKAQNAQRAGAKGVIIANNDASAPFTMGGTASLKVSAVMVSQADGATLRGLVAPAGTMRVKAVQPLQIDASLDTDIVFHEYGHGLTWRMIGDMDGPLAGAIGEGASDTVAFMVNGDSVIAEYSASDPKGIRRFAYAGYPLTYGDVTGAEVHDDGEIYAAAMWKLRELWIGNALDPNLLFDYFIDGMNYTPSMPAFEDMRNGMLAAIDNDISVNQATQDARCTLVWQAFAALGIGDGAVGTPVGSSALITESFTPRANCTY